jgi:uncharacterized protein YegP (UPF0339 family)
MPSHEHFEKYQSKSDGDWRFRLVAANEKIVATGEGYETEEGVDKGMKTVVRVAMKTAGFGLGVAAPGSGQGEAGQPEDYLELTVQTIEDPEGSDNGSNNG